MSKIGKRPNGLIAIVVYKAFTGILLAVTSISIFLAIENFDQLQEVAKSVTLVGKRGMIAWVLEKVVNLSPRTLLFSGLATGAYAVVTSIEAVGLWYEQSWARWLVIFVVGISIPAEIYELTKGISPVKLVVFLLNLAIFWYLIQEFPKLKSEHGSKLDPEIDSEIPES